MKPLDIYNPLNELPAPTRAAVVMLLVLTPTSPVITAVPTT
jgi:hypothetical protein